jgi:hypothetical protein
MQMSWSGLGLIGKEVEVLRVCQAYVRRTQRRE